MRSFLVVALAAASVAACGQAATATPPASSSRSAAPSTVREAARPDPYFDYGFVVQLTQFGFHPHVLVSPCCNAITWKNTTSTTAEVRFDALQVDSGPIPPGGTFIYTPHHIESVAYHLVADPSLTGAVQVNQTSEP